MNVIEGVGMGASLYGFMIRGPRELEASRVRVAEAWVENVVGQARMFLAEYDGHALGRTPSRRVFRRMLSGYDALPVHWRDCEPDEVYDDLLTLAGYDLPELAVRHFWFLWMDPRERDVYVRDFGRERVLFVGEMSSGEEPSGRGYLTVKMAELFGVLPILGIE